MSAESPRHARASPGGGGPLTVPAQPPADRSLIDAVSGFINDVTLSSNTNQDPKDVIQWARFETADINEPTPEGDSDNDISPLLLILGYGSGVQVWLVPPAGEAQEVLSWRQGTVRVLRILPTPQHGDSFASKRPLIALCDSASPGPSFCSLSFISIRGGEQVKSIKFKNPILDVLANKRSVVVSFSERFAVFDAATLEDRMAVTTCYPCPCPLGGSASINPLALGDRWLAYADKKLNQSKRSSGGCEGEGQSSYTATVLHAAKSLSKGLRGLGESVAHSLAGGRGASQSPSPPTADTPQPGVITILDVEGNEEEEGQDDESYESMVAHFVAHSEPVIALKFDPSGMLLLTADRRGHDFHVFRLNPHPLGPALASVHHLYILHRGDTTAKVQDIAISADSRWAAVSTLRGTTHVFAMSAYGGACGVRTHTAPRVVNRLSRFQRSAGLPIHPHTAPTGSPVSESCGAWFPNPRLPPYPSPTVGAPLAQLRPTATLPTHTITRTSSGRQRLSSLSEDSNTVPLLARARFGPPPPPAAGGAPRPAPQAALYLMSATGCLSHIALHARPARSVPKEKVCDESPIELEVEAVAQWPLQRPPAAADLLAPLPPSSPLLQPTTCRRCADMCVSAEERWLAQVEIVTHAGPHRRLWMGPQFVFKTYNCTGSNSSLSEAETVEVDPSATLGVARSNPVNMPAARPVVPVLIDSGSASSLEHSPSDSFRRKSLLAESGRAASVCDVQLKEDLAEAMKEDQGWVSEAEGADRAAARCGVARAVGPAGTVVARAAAHAPPPLDADSYTRSNEDEATFRPVVRAPASLPLDADMVVRPLPRTTTIPVQTVAPFAGLSPADEPLPLNTHVVIPAALDAVSDWHASNTVNDNVVVKPPIVSVEDDSAGKSFVSVKHDDTPANDEAINNEESKKEHSVAVEKSTEERPSKVESIKTERAFAQRDTKEKKKDVSSKIEKSAKQKDNPDFKLKDQKKSVVKADKPLHEDAKLDRPLTQVNLTKKESTKQDEKSTKIEAAKGQKPVKQKIEEPKVAATKQDAHATDVETIDSVNVDVKHTDVNIDLMHDEKDVRKRESARASVEHKRTSADSVEFEYDHSKTLPKSNRQSGDIQPAAIDRIKKSPTPKSVSDRDSEFISKDKSKRSNEPKYIETKLPKEIRDTKELKKQKDVEDFKNKEAKSSVSVELKTEKNKSITLPTDVNIDKTEEIVKVSKHEELVIVEDEPSVSITLKINPKETLTQHSDEIRTEEQAWDMLLNEPDRSVVISEQQEDKPKSKKNRKFKKPQEEQQSSREDDSFVEIHAIEEKPESCSGELVSISTPFEEIEPTLYKTKKRLSKTSTPEKKDLSKSIEILPHEETESICTKQTSKNYDAMVDAFLSEIVLSPGQAKKEGYKVTNVTKGKKYSDGTASETSSVWKELPKPGKSKSLSPYPELRKPEDKDVYVINSTDVEFPEIQITIGNKSGQGRKRSPHLREKGPVVEKTVKSWSSIAADKEALVEKPIKSWSSIAADKEPFAEKPVKSWSSITADKEPFAEKPIKSWSSIAADKESAHGNPKNSWNSIVTDKIVDEKPSKSWSSVAALKSTNIVEEIEKKFDNKKYLKMEKDDDSSTSSTVSLQEKLIELCKRADIIVAECDAPSELNFVEEHHAVLQDLPPLEPLDFGLDDFKMEVMRDSLLEIHDPKITSPICKINIDDILSSIKETTAKAIESSAFNLIDLEKLPAKKEKGFSVIEGHKIVSQEIKIDDDGKIADKDGEIMEKSSEDDTSPVVSTDSDKEDKKNTGASNIVLPSSKQSAKAKKSRRKKK